MRQRIDSCLPSANGDTAALLAYWPIPDRAYSSRSIAAAFFGPVAVLPTQCRVLKLSDGKAVQAASFIAARQSAATSRVSFCSDAVRGYLTANAECAEPSIPA